MKKLKLINIYILTIIIIIFIFMISGCSTETRSSAWEYNIHINGINYTSDNISEILVPMPMRNGAPLFNNDNITYQKNDKSDNWSEEIVDTQYGKMLSFKTSEHNLKNISFKISQRLLPYDATLSERKNISREIMISPLSPGSISSTGQYTRYETAFMGTHYNNSSYIYIDDNIISNNDNQTIEILIYMIFNGGSQDTNKIPDEHYQATIYETIPADVRGWIPVTLQSNYQI